MAATKPYTEIMKSSVWGTAHLEKGKEKEKLFFPVQPKKSRELRKLHFYSSVSDYAEGKKEEYIISLKGQLFLLAL